MDDTDLQTFGSFENHSEGTLSLQSDGGATQTIDLGPFLTQDLYSTGSFDLSAMEGTSVGKLLDALPIPALLIDERHDIGFANQPWANGFWFILPKGHKQVLVRSQKLYVVFSEQELLCGRKDARVNRICL
jgi:hypothetical protein